MLNFKLTINDTQISNSLILDKVEFSTTSNNRDLSVGDFLFTIAKCTFHYSVGIQYGDVVKISITDEEGTEHPYGIYEPYNITHTDFSTDVELYAMPIISLMKNYTPLFPTSSYTTQTLLQEMQLELGFTVATTDNFSISSITMGVIEADTGINLLSKIALQLGGNVFINRDGEVEFKILSRNTFTITSSQITQLSRGENEYSITQVIGKTGNGDNDTTYTSGTYTTDAHTLTVTSQYLTQSVVDRILTILEGVRYYAYKLKVFDFPLDANVYDKITFVHYRVTDNLVNEETGEVLVEDDDLDLESTETLVSFPIMNIKLTFSVDGLVGEVESLVSSEASKDTGFKGSFTKRLEIIKNLQSELSTKVEVIDGSIQTVISKTDVLESDMTTVKNEQSSINQSLTSITSRVEANETNLSDNYLTKEQTITQIEQTASSITQSVVSEEVGKISIGARNFILESGTEKVITSPDTNGDTTYYDYMLSSEAPYLSEENKNEESHYMTLSLWVNDTTNPFTNILIGSNVVYPSDMTVKQIATSEFKMTKTIAIANGKKLSYLGEYKFVIKCQNNGSTTSCTILRCQLENGTISSDWSEALEDITDRYNQTLDNMNNNLTDKITEATDNLTNEFNDKIDLTVEQIVEGNQSILDTVNNILSDDFISDKDRADLTLVYKEITSQYDNVLLQVNNYDEQDYFSSFTDNLTTSYTLFSEALSNVINNGDVTGRVALQKLLVDFYDAYNILLYILSQYIKNQYEMLSSEIVQMKDSISLVVSEIDNELNEYKNFLKFSDEGLELFTTVNGQVGKFRMILSENRLSFYEGNQEVAYISNEKMFISKAEITTELKLGDIVARKGANNGFVFQANE